MDNRNNFLGFYSLNDFLQSLLGLKNWITNVAIGLLGATSTFITGYIWDTPSAIYFLWILMFFDWVTGIWKSMRKKEFVSYKLFRMPLFYVATSIVISFSWWMEKGSIIFYLLPGFVLASFYSVYFVSLLENLGELELLPKPLVVVLKKKFGLKVLAEKYFKESVENEDV